MTLIAPVQKKFTIHRTFFLHAAWLDQISIHCPIFLTAASRRSLDRVSVPVWGTFLSEPLDIVALVCRYHSNQLMSREPIRIRRVFQARAMRPTLLWEISRRFRRLCPGYGQVAHVLRTLPPVAARVLPPSAAPRLACVKPAASVHPEPGSNSSLYISFYNSLALSCNSSYFFLIQYISSKIYCI